MTEQADQIARLRRCGVVPVVTIHELSQAVPLARALAEGGLDMIEVTLRTECALEAIEAICDDVPEVCVGAGTILSEGDVDAAGKAGAAFLVSPATPPGLVLALQDFDGLVIPGVSTATEALARYDEGFAVQKLFPAELSGGAPFLKAIQAPIPSISFMPTGGVNTNNLASYLTLPNVLAAGGSWLAPKDFMQSGQWREITQLAHEARQLVATIRSGA